MAVAAYCICGMIAGILNRFGKLGVVGGFVLGNVVLSYVANGLVSNVILLKEILIAGIGLLAVPKNINLKLEDFIGEKKFLPIGKIRGLNKSKETAQKLNNVSKAVKDMAKTYKNVAATLVDEEDIKEKNKQTFISELLNNLDHMEDNVLYDIIQDVEGDIVSEIFNKLMDKGFIKEKDLLKILAKNNNYVIGFNNDEPKTTRDVEKMTNTINAAFRISKMNFVWSVKLNEEKQNFQTQLNGVSKAISDIARDLNQQIENENLYTQEEEQIVLLLKQKEILIQEISINKKNKNKYKIELYVEEEKEDEKIILNIISKVLKEKMMLKERKKIATENIIRYEVTSDDKYIIDIGQSIAIKDGMPVSGDSILQTKIEDRKIPNCNQ